MLEGLGLGEGALSRMVRSAYHLLGLRTFLTTGEKETRAWTFRAGAKAPAVRRAHPHRLPARLHPAEVIHWDELLELGSWNKAKDVGKLRVEGKDYVVRTATSWSSASTSSASRCTARREPGARSADLVTHILDIENDGDQIALRDAE